MGDVIVYNWWLVAGSLLFEASCLMLGWPLTHHHIFCAIIYHRLPINCYIPPVVDRFRSTNTSIKLVLHELATAQPIRYLGIHVPSVCIINIVYTAFISLNTTLCVVGIIYAKLLTTWCAFYLSFSILSTEDFLLSIYAIVFLLL